MNFYIVQYYFIGIEFHLEALIFCQLMKKIGRILYMLLAHNILTAHLRTFH